MSSDGPPWELREVVYSFYVSAGQEIDRQTDCVQQAERNRSGDGRPGGDRSGDGVPGEDLSGDGVPGGRIRDRETKLET